jgi:hypothetical protein
VKVLSNPKIAIQGSLWVFPGAEKMYFATDFLAPLAVVVGSQGKRRIRFFRFGSLAFGYSHGIAPCDNWFS